MGLQKVGMLGLAQSRVWTWYMVLTSSSRCYCCFIDTVRRGDDFGGVVKVTGKVTCLVGPGMESLGYHVL
jgi:hypothetical protein